MIVSCPSCSTRFVVDPAAIGAKGRRVRCANCAHVWHQSASADDLAVAADAHRPAAAPEPAVPEAPSDPSPQTPRRPPPAPRTDPTAPEPTSAGTNLPAMPTTRRRGPVVIGWVLLLLLVVGILTAGYVGRSQVVRLWPPAVKLYDSLGIPVDLDVGSWGSAFAPGLVSTVGMPVILEEGDQSTWVLPIEIGNQSEVPRRLPALAGELVSSDGTVLQSWAVGPPVEMLEPGEVTAFETRFTDYDGNTARFRLVAVDADNSHDAIEAPAEGPASHDTDPEVAPETGAEAH